MSKETTANLGSIIRKRRRHFSMTQEELALRIRTSTTYVMMIETGRRHPSQKLVSQLARELGYDPGELFLLANPGAKALILTERNSEDGEDSAWSNFAKDVSLRELHNITDAEMQVLAQVAKMGQVRSSRDFLFILHTIRQALGS